VGTFCSHEERGGEGALHPNWELDRGVVPPLGVVKKDKLRILLRIGGGEEEEFLNRGNP